MNKSLFYRRSTLIISLILLCIFSLTQCVNKKEENATSVLAESQLPPEKKFAGSEACANCHRDIYATHIHTAHYLTSQPASALSIKGNFKQGKNTFTYNPSVSVAMEKKDSSFYQVEYVNGIEKKRKRFDIVVGSGVRGQTYLYWENDNIFQLPVFYYTAKDEWANSPGFSGKVIFNRPITSRCLECHSTYARKLTPGEQMPESFSHAKMVYGIDCEKCHGPAADHVAFHTKNSNDTIGKYIINPSTFTRQQKLDMCALCHGGRLTKIKPSFSFEAGDTLANFFTPNNMAPNTGSIDVHGNQYGLLTMSKCFLKSDITCNDCHDTHVNEKGKTALYAQRCLSCHNTTHGKVCKLTETEGTAIDKNCTDCHMPEQISKSITFLEQGNPAPVAAYMHTHYIKVYPEETKKVLAFINKIKGNHK